MCCSAHTVFSGLVHWQSHLVASIKALLMRKWELRLLHIYRESNFIADWLATTAKSWALGCHKLQVLPAELLTWLAHDKIGISYDILIAM